MHTFVLFIILTCLLKLGLTIYINFTIKCFFLLE